MQDLYETPDLLDALVSMGVVFGGRLQVGFNGKGVWAIRTERAERFRQPQQILGIGAAGARGRSYLAGDIRIGRMAKKGFVVFGGNVHQTLGMAAIIEGKPGAQAQVTVLFPDIQMLEHLGRHPVRHALADSAGLLYQGNHAAGRFRRAPVIVGSLPEPSFPPADRRRALLQEGEIDLVDQGTIAEQPDRFHTGKIVSLTIVFNGIGRHQTPCSKNGTLNTLGGRNKTRNARQHDFGGHGREDQTTDLGHDVQAGLAQHLLEIAGQMQQHRQDEQARYQPQ